MNLHRGCLRRAGTGCRVALALCPVARFGRGQPRCPPKVGQPPCGRCRGLPTAAAAGTDALRWTKPAACPRSGCLAFEKLNPGERGGARRRAWTTASGCPPPATVAPVPGTLRLGGRGSRGPVREGAPGAQPWGSGVQAPAWERPRRGGDRASEARRGLWTPLWGLFMPVAGAQLPHTRPSGL